MEWLQRIVDDPAVIRIGEAIMRADRGPGLGSLPVRGVVGSSTVILALALHKRLSRPILLVTAHLDDADEAIDVLEAASIDAFRFPAMELLPGETSVSLELLAERLTLVRRLIDGSVPPIIVAPIQALMQSVPNAKRLDKMLRVIRPGDRIDAADLARWLSEAGYNRVEAVDSPGEFAVRGGIIDLFPPGGTPARMDLFGDSVESLFEIDLDSMGSDRKLDRLELVGASLESLQSDHDVMPLAELLPRESVAILAELIEIVEQGRSYFDRASDARGIFGPPAVLKSIGERCSCVLEVNQFTSGAGAETAIDLDLQPIPSFAEEASQAMVELAELASTHETIVLCQNEGETQRLKELLAEFAPGAPVEAITQYLHRGFIWGASSFPPSLEGGGQGVGEVTGQQNISRTAQTEDLQRSGHFTHTLALPLKGEGTAPTPPSLEGGGKGVGEVTGQREDSRPARSEKHQESGHFTHTPALPLKGEGTASTTAPTPQLALIPYHELLHRYFTRRRVHRLAAGRAMDTFLELLPGDYVVHRDHGIARFSGLQMIKTGDVPQEFLTLEFAGAAKIHVPTAQIDLVQKYVGAFKGKPELSTVGGVKWKNQKEKVAEAVRDLAAQMLRIQAARQAMPGIRYPPDTAWQREFEAEFPYEETDDQLAAISAVKKDMSDPRPMDRLVCGDVGFGKTEVAIRAAFKAAEFGKQVAVLVPTTVLAEQHDRTFHQRFADYPFRIESLSRFKTKKEQDEVVELVKKGQVDVVIGTHRLLSKDVRFADLGLVVVDEEQRFGVEHKQRLLEFRMTADVMTLSATPIPRTLHMALLGLRDISSLSTPPLDRRAIVTEVIGYSAHRIRQAIQRELAREGQVFFVHNRVYNIQAVADDIQKLVPDARIIIGHGQMPTRQLESVMLKFLRREADILVCTTIIESGIDIPTVNTMFINDAHRFGLSELHQLRGRVGRFKHRAYCYLLLPSDKVISEVAVKRLKAIESFSMLGAGFKIALRDLEIRGAGNLLGAEQSGHIAAVGYEMYCQLLEQAVSDLKNERHVIVADTAIDIGIVGSIPKGYIPSDVRRMDAYRRIGRAQTLDTLRQVERDLVSAYGELPRSAGVLIEVAELRLAAASIGVRSIARHEQDIIFRTERPGELELRMTGAAGSLRIVGQPDSSGLAEVYYRPPANYLEPVTLLTVLRKRLQSSQPSLLVAASASR